MLPRVLLLLIIASIAVGGWLSTWVLWRYRQAEREIGRLEIRHFEAPTVVVLGSGGPFENPSRRGPAVAFGAGEQLLLVDAGRAVAEGLRAAGVPTSQPRVVHLTSLLPENTVGLDDLLLAGWRAGRTQPLRVIGPPGTQALARALEAAQAEAVRALAEMLELPRDGARLEAVERSADWTQPDGAIVVRAARLGNDPLAAFAYRFEAEGRSAVVGAAGSGRERLAELARGAGALVHGAVFLPALRAALEAGVSDADRLEREGALSLSLDAVSDIAQQAHVRQLVLVRLQPPPLFDFQFERVARKRFRGSVRVARDGDEFTP